MSRSTLGPEHPCKKFIDFKGDKGQFFYYDKATQKQVELSCPLYFVVLDELSTITGFNNEFECGVYSNEIHYLDRELMRVRTFKGGKSITGYYKAIKDNIKAIGGKYTKSIYAMMIDKNGGTELVNFRFHGGALQGWIDKKINAAKFIIGVSEFRQEKNGAIKFMVPVFKPYELTEAINEKAVAMDVELQKYLSEYKTRQMEREEVMENAVIDADPPADVDIPQTEEDMAREGWQALYPEPDQPAAGNEAAEPLGVDKLPF